ncbi:metallophosphoesterase [Pendulispora brunnea]|uniref:Metallophosphoesterase n=1 Tax=Pendulispora brunnea TaxID=2905690 RepID=A0ABZ2JYJ3_9BACT
MNFRARRPRRSRWMLVGIAPIVAAAAVTWGLSPQARAQSTEDVGTDATFVLVAAGDIAEQCTASDPNCVHPKTAALVQEINPAVVITMGDNQYDDARYQDFKNYFDKTWGRFKNIMRPVPGNHETYDSTPLAGYKKYFGSIATPKGKTYYSWDKGNWHFIALDSNDFSGEYPLTDDAQTDDVELAADSAQLKWLKSDLSNTTKGCVAVYYHHPRFSSGPHGDNKDVAPVWSTLVANKVDLVLNGHDHLYERFAPQDANGKASSKGPVEIIVGSAGRRLSNPKAEHSTTEALLKKYGVLKLTMTDSTFSTQLIGTNGEVLDRSPTYKCH